MASQLAFNQRKDRCRIFIATQVFTAGPRAEPQGIIGNIEALFGEDGGRFVFGSGGELRGSGQGSVVRKRRLGNG